LPLATFRAALALAFPPASLGYRNSMLSSSRTALSAACRSTARRAPAPSLRQLSTRVAAPRVANHAAWIAATALTGAVLGYSVYQLKPELIPAGESPSEFAATFTHLRRLTSPSQFSPKRMPSPNRWRTTTSTLPPLRLSRPPSRRPTASSSLSSALESAPSPSSASRCTQEAST